MTTGTDAILAFWFGEIGPDRWWVKSDETDAAIHERFADLREDWRARTPESFLGSARDALAGVILFDQFSRNLCRDSAEAFATDSLALAIAKGAIDRGLDETLTDDERVFLYMPFQHSENLDDQQSSLLLFTRLGIQNSIDFAKKHHDIIEKFGRFPHRNAVLGRPDRPGEEEAIEQGKDW